MTHSAKEYIELLLYTGGCSKTLLFSLCPSDARVALTDAAQERPAVPTMFCMLLRKHLQSARIRSVTALENERVLKFVIDSFDELGHPAEKRIYAEIMGKYSNLIFCDGNDRILGALHTTDITASTRRIFPGGIYERPPAQNKHDALSTGSDGEEADAPRTGALADAPHAAHPDTGLKPHSAAQPGTDSSIGPDAHSPAPAATRPSAHPATRPKTLPGDRRRVVVIFVESLESWVLERSVEGQELTPCLNRLLHEERTLYAPQVVTQVKGGRSIDAQLLVTAGLLPLENGCWSARCPHTAYPSLVKAFRQRHPGSRALLFTPDKEIVWNQMIVAREFGFDSLLSHKHFRNDRTTGTGSRRRLCDGAFFDQCLEKLAEPQMLPDTAGACYLQFVTYSSHHPFVIPEELHRIRLRQEMPRRLRDYLTAVNYVDHALGEFIAALRRNPRLSDAMIVITGDHEGLASERPALASSAAGRGLVSEGRFTPLIVVNAPAAMRCTDTVGQIDIYPTLLDLLGLDDYHWHGLGRSLLRADAPRAAVDPRLERVGAAVDSTTEQHLRQAWSLSDRIIRSDYFRHTGRE